MRLKAIENDQRGFDRLKLRLIGWWVGQVPDVMRVMLHRPEFFGRHFLASAQEALRGPSGWSAGERELFAAFVSAKNQCPF